MNPLESDRVTTATPPPTDGSRRTIPYTELPEDTTGQPLATEWNFYRREVGRLLAEGHEGRWILIRGEQLIGIWGDEQSADAAARERFPGQPALVHQIVTEEPVFRGPNFRLQCHN
jgi:hypothetical protein